LYIDYISITPPIDIIDYIGDEWGWVIGDINGLVKENIYHLSKNTIFYRTFIILNYCK
jgi:hypothetical protein